MTLRYCEPELRRLLSRLDARGDGASLVACHLAMALDAIVETDAEAFKERLGKLVQSPKRRPTDQRPE